MKSFLPRSRVSAPLHFAPAGAKPNKIVFAALARVAKTPRLKRLGRCRQ